VRLPVLPLFLEEIHGFIGMAQQLFFVVPVLRAMRDFIRPDSVPDLALSVRPGRMIPCICRKGTLCLAGQNIAFICRKFYYFGIFEHRSPGSILPYNHCRPMQIFH